MSRVTVYHLTTSRRLPLIEEEGLRTRADLSGRLGTISDFDRAAPGTFANGRRVSFYVDLEHARTRTDEHGPGLVETTVDPAKAIAVPGSKRDGDPEAYWAAARPLKEWVADGDLPADLEVHQNVPVRAKHLQLRAALYTDDELGHYAPLVEAVADVDRVSAKALMHLAIIASDAEFDSPEFRTAVALAYRDDPDPDSLVDELVEIGPDKVASAALAEYGTRAQQAADILRDALEDTRAWADENGLPHGQGIFVRSATVLEELDRAEAEAGDGDDR